MGGAKNKRALARPTCVSKPLTKFGWILSSGFGGDSITDRRTDGRTDRRTDRRTEATTISLTLFLKSMGININPFSPNLLCVLILWRSDLGLQMGKFRHLFSDRVIRPPHDSGGELSFHALRKHAYSNILKMLPPKNENFQINNSDILQISALNIDCGARRGGSNAYPQSMLLSRNKKK